MKIRFNQRERRAFARGIPLRRRAAPPQPATALRALAGRAYLFYVRD